MGLELEYISGQTPFDEDEKEGLLIPTITTRSELDEFEQLNIEKAVEWILTKSFSVDQVLIEKFIMNLHQRMFGDVWRWAGEFRKTEKSIGCDPVMIGVELRNLINDAKYWIDHKTIEEDEIAVQFSHRIVKIHCFPNGNGRHSRLIGDILIEKVFGKNPFTWGGSNLTSTSEIRTKYINALRSADEGNYTSLIEFARE